MGNPQRDFHKAMAMIGFLLAGVHSIVGEELGKVEVAKLLANLAIDDEAIKALDWRAHHHGPVPVMKYNVDQYGYHERLESIMNFGPNHDIWSVRKPSNDHWYLTPSSFDSLFQKYRQLKKTPRGLKGYERALAKLNRTKIIEMFELGRIYGHIINGEFWAGTKVEKGGRNLNVLCLQRSVNILSTCLRYNLNNFTEHFGTIIDRLEHNLNVFDLTDKEALFMGKSASSFNSKIRAAKNTNFSTMLRNWLEQIANGQASDSLRPIADDILDNYNHNEVHNPLDMELKGLLCLGELLKRVWQYIVQTMSHVLELYYELGDKDTLEHYQKSVAGLNRALETASQELKSYGIPVEERHFSSSRVAFSDDKNVVLDSYRALYTLLIHIDESIPRKKRTPENWIRALYDKIAYRTNISQSDVQKARNEFISTDKDNLETYRNSVIFEDHIYKTGTSLLSMFGGKFGIRAQFVKQQLDFEYQKGFAEWLHNADVRIGAIIALKEISNEEILISKKIEATFGVNIKLLGKKELDRASYLRFPRDLLIPPELAVRRTLQKVIQITYQKVLKEQSEETLRNEYIESMVTSELYGVVKELIESPQDDISKHRYLELCQLSEENVAEKDYNRHDRYHMLNVTQTALQILQVLKDDISWLWANHVLSKDSQTANNCTMLAGMWHDVGIAFGRSDHAATSAKESEPYIRKILAASGRTAASIEDDWKIIKEMIADHSEPDDDDITSPLHVGILRLADVLDTKYDRLSPTVLDRYSSNADSLINLIKNGQLFEHFLALMLIEEVSIQADINKINIILSIGDNRDLLSRKDLEQLSWVAVGLSHYNRYIDVIRPKIDKLGILHSSVNIISIDSEGKSEVLRASCDYDAKKGIS
ncbi:MAG: hypothetical protein ACFFEJ_19335 [Candidatus Thorarchaeota archaeon]